MSDDWQPGDLALCVSDTHPAFSGRSTILRVGAKYTVSRVGSYHAWLDDRALGLAEAAPRKEGNGFPSKMFCKIRPHTPDAEDAETIALLTGGKVPA